MPRVRLRRKSGIKKRKFCKLKMNSPERVIDYTSLQERFQFARKHYKKRKKLFVTTKSLLISNRRSAAHGSKILMQKFKPRTVGASIRKTWLNFLTNYSNPNQELFLSHLRTSQALLNKQIKSFLNDASKKIYGVYDFLFQEWKPKSIRVRTRFK